MFIFSYYKLKIICDINIIKNIYYLKQKLFQSSHRRQQSATNMTSLRRNMIAKAKEENDQVAHRWPEAESAARPRKAVNTLSLLESQAMGQWD